MISKRKSRSLTNLDNTSKTANDHRKPLFVRSNARNKKRFRNYGNQNILKSSYNTQNPVLATNEPLERYSRNIYTERRIYGQDENGRLLRVEKDPKEPVRTVTPVRPVTPVMPIDDIRHPKFIQPFDALPLTIPRIDITRNFGINSPTSRSISSFNEQVPSPHSLASNDRSLHSAYFSPTSPSINSGSIPMKKIIKKSRWLSVHDGKPVSPFIETVAYVPYYANPYSYEDDRSTDFLYREPQRYYRQYSDSYLRYADECSIFVENPLYRD